MLIELHGSEKRVLSMHVGHENFKGRNHLGKLFVDKKITLKWTSRNGYKNMDWLLPVQVDVQLLTSVKNMIIYIFQRHWERGGSSLAQWPSAAEQDLRSIQLSTAFNSPSYRQPTWSYSATSQSGVRNEAPNLATRGLQQVYGAMVKW
jgi:hypothetical protein